MSRDGRVDEVAEHSDPHPGMEPAWTARGWDPSADENPFKWPSTLDREGASSSHLLPWANRCAMSRPRV